ncbi:UV-endonuclease UvdE-domain-containing protein [Truncatella angustata]|uniref:UV-endonuclease UvdE-domain-containing protein n=1 Tax=Truncatella angustata TaxID=152316 RepID=A0A9P9A332_9PEZI|nr:UV-endonuclease UvdE-domain-containing protein [Truncatella angustata]KAH6658535.1 UV-endonuclease UvdE-domain-containing protein [Truncatella angustata]
MASDAAVGEGEEADGNGVEAEDINALKTEGGRPPPVNSDYLPLPWKGRLGYACLNTYLRISNPQVFSSRTCRIASIVEHRHPLKDPSQPEHAIKNRPDKDQPADVARGQRYVEELGLANARDIVKMLRWNDKYHIKFMRLSSEMFPFASHEEYGYKLAPFASEALAEAGRVAGELGHRLTTHPGQFTQLGSPRKEVVTNAVRDLEYHDELLTLLKLPEQQNKDAVMILHMGGVFGDKEATLQRFRENYARLSDSIKARLVLENDDVCYTVHDLLPICEELNIPMVLDFHHHNILFDKDKIREGTKDVMDLYPRIKATWDRKGITQKMHYSEPCPDAITGRQRRKHRPRVTTLPPCVPDMDLMIEAKDKEQAVFELMRTYRLPGWDSFNDVVPYERDDENKPPPKPKATPKKKRKGKKGTDDDGDVEMAEPEPQVPREIPAEEVGMGGPENRVYWPVGMEEWLRPKKRETKKRPNKGEEKEDFKEVADDS